MPTLVIQKNPFYPWHDRTVAEIKSGALIKDLVPNTQLPFICIKNDEPLMRAQWGLAVEQDDIVIFQCLPLGGGFKDALRIAATIAVAYYTMGTGSAWLGTAETFTVYATKAAAFAVGMYAVNSIFPPQYSTPDATRAMSAPSPTYSLQGRGNRARLGEPIPVIYGRHLIYPDMAANPYTRFAGNEQYLYQLHCIGQGEYDVSDIKIDKTPIDNFPEVQYEVINPGEEITLLDDVVITSKVVSGQQPKHGGLLGPFIVNQPGTVIDKIGFDLVAAGGLYRLNDKGNQETINVYLTIEAQKIDDEGNALGDWFHLPQQTHTIRYTSYDSRTTYHLQTQYQTRYDYEGKPYSVEVDVRVPSTGEFKKVATVTTNTVSILGNSNTAIRKTYQYPVPPGRYQVRTSRTTGDETSSRVVDKVALAALRGFVKIDNHYGDVTLLAIKMRASNNLSQQASRQINCIVTKKIPTWSKATGWSKRQASRSIAWAACDIIKSHYGAFMPDHRLSLSEFEALDKKLSERGDHFDFVFDQKQTIWEALQLCLQAGRTTPVLQGGIIRPIRDEKKQLSTALFSARNIKEGSFNLHYEFNHKNLIKAHDVEYIDSNMWLPLQVKASLANDQYQQSIKLKLAGITDHDHAFREGVWRVAASKHRRISGSFTTELEGYIPMIGDSINVQMDWCDWGQAGEVIEIDNLNLTLDQEIKDIPFNLGLIMLRKPDGSVSGPHKFTYRPRARNKITLKKALDWQVNTENTSERTHYVVGASNRTTKLCKVVSIKPRGLYAVEVHFIVDDDRVYQADTQQPPPRNQVLYQDYDPPVISAVEIQKLSSSENSAPLFATITASGDYHGCVILISIDDGSTFTELTRTNELTAMFNVQTGQVFILRFVPLDKNGYRTIPYDWRSKAIIHLTDQVKPGIVLYDQIPNHYPNTGSRIYPIDVYPLPANYKIECTVEHLGPGGLRVICLGDLDTGYIHIQINERGVVIRSFDKNGTHRVMGYRFFITGDAYPPSPFPIRWNDHKDLFNGIRNLTVTINVNTNEDGSVVISYHGYMVVYPLIPNPDFFTRAFFSTAPKAYRTNLFTKPLIGLYDPGSFDYKIKQFKVTAL